MYQTRTYQKEFNSERFRSFMIAHKETELWIGIDPYSFRDEIKDKALQKVKEMRKALDNYISMYPEFANSLVPYHPGENTPVEVIDLCQASQKAGIGPMSAVAGLFAQRVGEEICQNFSVEEMVIENGGDLYLLAKDEIVLSVFAGNSPLSQKVGVKIPANQTPIGVCTSAGTVGPSFSLGKADAVMVACRDTLVADAFATALGNKVKRAEDVAIMLKSSEEYTQILSVIAICDEKIGIRGNFEVKFLK